MIRGLMAVGLMMDTDCMEVVVRGVDWMLTLI